MATVTLFSDFICPFCYLGEQAAAPALVSLGLVLDWRGYAIHPEIPPEGIPAERMSLPGFKGVWSRVEALAAEARLPIRRPPVFPSSLLALEGAELARREGRLARYRERIFGAFFVEGQNIGDPDVLGELVAEIGLDRSAFGEEVLTRRFRSAVENHREYAEDLLVSAVPAFFLHGVPVIGAMSSEDFRRVFSRILKRRAAKRA